MRVYVRFVAMGKSCCAVGCTNRYEKGKNLSFYRFPVEPNRRARWTAAVNRKNWMPNRNTWICSAHFISGAKSDDPLSPSYVPTVFSYVKSPVKRKAAQDLARYERGTVAKKRKEDYTFRQLQETAMAHEEQGGCSLAEDTSLEAQNSPLDPDNKDGTAEVEVGTDGCARFVLAANFILEAVTLPALC